MAVEAVQRALRDEKREVLLSLFRDGRHRSQLLTAETQRTQRKADRMSFHGIARAS